MSLRTLKDLRKNSVWIDKYCLREEAIGHLKEIKKEIAQYNEKLEKAGDWNDIQANQKIGQLIWIKDFFNITEEKISNDT